MRTEAKTMTFKNSQEAFEHAIQVGRLSADKAQAKYAGNYMYMGTDESGRDLFKNIDTRRYDV
jgi:ABC-type dipeptide/oligopeptide/nickel transport system permease subunit